MRLIGREAAFLSDRAALLRMRLMSIRSKQCASVKNKTKCPEIFLDVVSTKLTSTAVLFLNVELLSEFFYAFPRELDVRLGRGLSQDEVDRFAKEDPKVKAHLEVIRRKELLELVLSKMEGLRDLDVQEKTRRAQSNARGHKEGKKGWGLF
jgi:hypothetical protein